MSNTDSFIEEVTEEVRRDRLFALMKRYGWIAVVAILLVVGGAAYNEYSKAQSRASAQALGDEIITALAENEPAARADRLAGVTAGTPGGRAIVQFLLSAEQAEAGQRDAAVEGLNRIAVDGDVPEIYRQIATFKALTLQADTTPAAERRTQFEALARPGQPLRLLAQEQLALIDIAEGQTAAAIERLQAVLQDAEADRTMQQRAAQVIVALGGTPELRPDAQG